MSWCAALLLQAACALCLAHRDGCCCGMNLLHFSYASALYAEKSTSFPTAEESARAYASVASTFTAAWSELAVVLTVSLPMGCVVLTAGVSTCGSTTSQTKMPELATPLTGTSILQPSHAMATSGQAKAGPMSGTAGIRSAVPQSLHVTHGAG